MFVEGLGEMFEGHSADTRRVSRAQTRERGPPSVLAEIFIIISLFLDFTTVTKTTEGHIVGF